MENSRWPVVLITIILIGLIYNFLNTIFKSDIKRFSHDRIYVDYQTYKKPIRKTQDQPMGAGPISISHQMELAARSRNRGRAESSLKAYMAVASRFAERAAQADGAKPIPPSNSPAYEEVRRLASVKFPEETMGRLLLQKGHYERALTVFNEILANVPEADLYHRVQLYDLIGECYFATKNYDGYLQYKTKFVEYQKKFRDIFAQVNPKAAAEMQVWVKVEDASQFLLRLNSTLERSDKSPEEKEAMRKRAELDLQIARSAN